ncbi:MAG: nitrate reductase [Deltaproteobacteria bacterium]|nr:nitrate reductase [Deltaproteobacteria bacterium]
MSCICLLNMVDERLIAKPDKWVQSACVLCSFGCGLDIGVKDGKIVGVRGRAEDRVNKGRLGPKGLHGWIANESRERLTHPLIRKPDGKLHPASWDEAMNIIVQRTKTLIDKYTSGSIGFYSTGQLFIEEYYTLAMVGHAGIGTNHMDGNTRLCTATAAASLRETFGADGQPGSYTDLDTTECLLVIGHNMANTQTVMFMRVLDRRRGSNPPKLVVIDPRKTQTASEADVHLAPRIGTNVAVLNGLLNLIIEAGQIDMGFIAKHTVGFEKLKEVVSKYTPERVEEITGIPKEKLREAARVVGSAKSLVSTALQGVYQSNQATAAAVQLNNINLVRGMIGKPGCGILQMNGQPTAQNNRETGCNGEFPGFRNWDNPEHMEDLAARWNIDPAKYPHWGPATHIMQMMRLAELGSLRMLWVICTNPAVSLPELARIRKILESKKLFLVVQDGFLTETAELADIVLPAAIWAEKVGTFTNVDRTVHISHKAIEPPGEARSDFDIFIDFARRMDFRDKDGNQFPPFNSPEEAFDHWRECSRGCICDYSAISYEKLTGGSGIQWPCMESSPEGTERLYSNFVFPTKASRCEFWGHDLETGAATTKEEYKANDPDGRAILKAAEYHPPLEVPDETYPFWFTTGRVVYQFHTRTKTGRSEELNAAAPDAFAELNAEDAARLGIKQGELIEISTRRGSIRVPAAIGEIEPGHVFVPFHYGYWDDETGRPRAANELTLSQWDPVSKQPYFKYAAARISKPGLHTVKEKLGDAAGKAVHQATQLADKVMGAAHVERSRVADYLGLLVDSLQQFSEACSTVSLHHFVESEVRAGLTRLSIFSKQSITELKPFVARYGVIHQKEPKKLRESLFPSVRPGAFGLLRDLHELFVLWSDVHMSLMALMQAALQLRDKELVWALGLIHEQTERQKSWLTTQVKHHAGQTLVVPS